MGEVVKHDVVRERIFVIRGQKIMLSTHLAELYGVEPKVLIQAVKRNIKRFPCDFMFPLTRQEVTILKSQFVTSRWGGMRRAYPYAFTELGISMLSSVLRSEKAIQINMAIMRAFVKLREFLAGNTELARKVEEHGKHIVFIYKLIDELRQPPEEKPKRKIGFQES